MALVDVVLSIEDQILPTEVQTFLREAEVRIEQFQRDCRVPAFIPSDYVRAYTVLRALSEATVAPGPLFCEWGSGFGVVACLAAMLGFDAHGIEIEAELVDAARCLAGDFDLPVEFICGSFIPAGSRPRLAADNAFAWLTVRTSHPADGSQLGPADFDIIFAYPWPDEEHVIATLFDRHAAPGAVLISYHEGEDFRIRRKVRSRKGRR
jgi:hypothetical protein